MIYKAEDLTIIEGLDFIRRRPTMYIGAGAPEDLLCSRLVEVGLDGVAADVPAPSAIRLTSWKAGVFTIAWDGEPLPVEPAQLAPAAVAHPEVYRLFLYLHDASQRLAFSGAILNALSERLVVSTVNRGDRYRVAFAKGMVVSLLGKAPCETPLGTNWLTFLPDYALLGDTNKSVDVEAIAARVGRRHSAVSFLDRSRTVAGWY